MKRRLRFHVTATCLVVLSTIGWVSDARAAGSEAVVLSPPFSAEWVLTVSGSTGGTLTRVFRPGEPVHVPVDDASLPIRDGEYTYELRSDSDALSGRFSVAKGRLESHAGSAVSFDQVIPDDLIVQGSLCVGFDCVNNESFGFDTIRLKENNLRIKFDDTSTIAGFPSNDWQLIANESPSGGNAMFAIEDTTGARIPFTIRAGAKTNSIFVDSTGRVGFGTSAPVLDLHAFTANTPGIRLDQNNSGGFTAQTWDIGANEANFFIRDVTGGSKLSLRIRPGAPTSSIDIAADGKVGIGKAAAESKLHVNGDVRLESVTAVPPPPDAGSINMFFESEQLNFQFSNNGRPVKVIGGAFSNARGIGIDGVARFDSGSGVPTPMAQVYMWYEASDGAFKIRFPNGVTASLSSAGAWTSMSSRAFKERITPLSGADAFSALRDLVPVRFFAKGGTDEHVGFIAEDVPELVATQGRDGIAAMDVVGVLTKVVQDQQARIDAMRAELAALKAAVEELRKK